MHKVLSGIKVLEQGTFITGPAAGMFLADLGADVIKIEQPGSGYPFRAFRGGLYSTHFQTYNRNKRSVTLNPKLPEDAAVFDELVKDADVYIQNFRPGAADRLGAGNPALAAWVAFLEHWQEERRMQQIDYPPVQQALQRIRDLSADEETRRLAFVRERALRNEISALQGAHDEGRQGDPATGPATAPRR